MLSKNKLLTDFQLFITAKEEYKPSLFASTQIQMSQELLLSSLTVDLVGLSCARDLLKQLNIPIYKYIKHYRLPLVIYLDQVSKESLLWLYEYFQHVACSSNQLVLRRYKLTAFNIYHYQVFSTNVIVKFIRMLENVYRGIYLEKQDPCIREESIESKKLTSKILKIGDFQCPVIQYVLSLDGMFVTYNEITKRFAADEGLLKEAKILIREVYRNVILSKNEVGDLNILHIVNLVLFRFIFQKIASYNKVFSSIDITKDQSFLQIYWDNLKQNEQNSIDYVNSIVSKLNGYLISQELVLFYKSRMESTLKKNNQAILETSK